MIPNMLLPELLTALHRNAELPSDLVKATSPQVYTSHEFLELEHDQIVNKEWIALAVAICAVVISTWLRTKEYRQCENLFRHWRSPYKY